MLNHGDSLDVVERDRDGLDQHVVLGYVVFLTVDLEDSHGNSIGTRIFQGDRLGEVQGSGSQRTEVDGKGLLNGFRAINFVGGRDGSDLGATIVHNA